MISAFVVGWNVAVLHHLRILRCYLDGDIEVAKKHVDDLILAYERRPE